MIDLDNNAVKKMLSFDEFKGVSEGELKERIRKGLKLNDEYNRLVREEGVIPSVTNYSIEETEWIAAESLYRILTEPDEEE